MPCVEVFAAWRGARASREREALEEARRAAEAAQRKLEAELAAARQRIAALEAQAPFSLRGAEIRLQKSWDIC